VQNDTNASKIRVLSSVAFSAIMKQLTQPDEDTSMNEPLIEVLR
jgi:hypothetical protein